MTSTPYDVFDDITADKGGKGGKWPTMPDLDADLGAIRGYLTAAARLPRNWLIESATRHGPYGSDPMTVDIRTPGPARNIAARFQNQRDASKPDALRGTLAEATRGMFAMPRPTPTQASDFYVVLCRLANVTEDSTMAEQTEAWLVEYMERADVVTGYTLRGGDGRYDALQALRDRREFDKARAVDWLKSDLPPGARWSLLVDTQTKEQWVRAGELATYIRHVIGVGRLGQHTLDALIRELGGERVRWEVNLRYRGFGHPVLVMYRVPTDLAFPTDIRAQDGDSPRVRGTP